MGIQIPDGYGQAKIIFSLVGDVEEMVTTFGYKNDTALSATTNAGNIRAEWMANFTTADLSNQYSVLGCEVTQKTGGVLFTGESRVTSAGGQAAACPTQNCALLIKKVTLSGGREGRGRCYLPGGYLAETDVTAAGIVTASVVTAFQAKATQFLDDLETAFLPMVLLHSNPVNTPDLVTNFTVDNLIATQRNRLRGR
jgi:hypothetical protein